MDNKGGESEKKRERENVQSLLPNRLIFNWLNGEPNFHVIDSS